MATNKKPLVAQLYVVSLLACHNRGTVSEYLLTIRKPLNLDPEKEISQDKRRSAYHRLNAFVNGMREIFLKRHDEIISDPKEVVCNVYHLGSVDADIQHLQGMWYHLYRSLYINRTYYKTSKNNQADEPLLDWQQKEMEKVATRIESKVSEYRRKQQKKTKQAEEDDQPRLF